MVQLEFHWLNPSGRIMALRSNQHLREMSTTNIFCGVKAAGAQGWTYNLHMPIVWKTGCLASWNPQGLTRPVQELPFAFYILILTSLESRGQTYRFQTYVHVFPHQPVVVGLFPRPKNRRFRWPWETNSTHTYSANNAFTHGAKRTLPTQ